MRKRKASALKPTSRRSATRTPSRQPRRSTQGAADLRKQNAALKRELSEALHQQTATSEVLRVISSSPTDIRPVLDAILQTAGRLCASEYALFFAVEDVQCPVIASNNAAADYVKYLQDHPIAVSRGSLVGRTVLERRTVHIPDCLAD